MNLDKLFFTLPTKWFKNEAEFTTWFWKQIKDKWWFFWKLSDMDIRLKPFDAFMQWDWLNCAIEFKKWNNKNKVNVYKLLETNQIIWLEKYQANWWNALIIYYSIFHNKYYIYDYIKDLEITL